MDVVGWTITYVVLAGLAALIASKRGRSGLKLFLTLVVVAVPAGIVGSLATKGQDLGIWLAMFGCLAVGLVWSVAAKSGAQVVTSTGAYGDHRKCPYCAEPVRTEAVKCKHCGSDIGPKPPPERKAIHHPNGVIEYPREP